MLINSLIIWFWHSNRLLYHIKLLGVCLTVLEGYVISCHVYMYIHVAPIHAVQRAMPVRSGQSHPQPQAPPNDPLLVSHEDPARYMYRGTPE